MEALSKVKELFPNLADISPGEIAALFERFDGRTRDDAGAFEDLPAGSSDAGWLGQGWAYPLHRWRTRRSGWAFWTGTRLPPPRASPAADASIFF